MFSKFWKIIVLCGLSVVCIGTSFLFAASEKGQISFEIKSMGLRHGTPNDVYLGTLSTAPYDQEISGQLNEYFWIEDMQGYITGHYTTIQCDGIYWPDDYMITWIYFKAGNTAPTLLQGVTGNVHIYPDLYQYTSIIHPMTYMYKLTVLSNKWITNIYGDKPRFKLLIPANAPIGSYSGTITFSFYMD